jgi:hypothetical protein
VNIISVSEPIFVYVLPAAKPSNGFSKSLEKYWKYALA